MKLCLNIENRRGGKSHRLQDDKKSWKPCPKPTEISKGDYVTNGREEVLSLLIPDQTILIDGEKHTIDSSDGIDYFNDKELGYQVYGFHNEVPDMPDREQLEQTLLNGDDRKDNTLLLMNDGQFQLFDTTETDITKNDPTIVLQYFMFIAGNGYVGAEIKDDNYKSYIDRHYHTGLKYWRDHLVDHRMHKQPNDIVPMKEKEYREVIDDIQRLSR